MALIQTLIPEPTIYERLCRVVADILVVEEAGQRALMLPTPPTEPLWRTFVHRSNPVIHWDCDDWSAGADIAPIVNVTFDQSNYRGQSSSNVRTISKQFQLRVDCYAVGYSSSALRADEMCGRDALNLAGKVEAILHSGPYAYLGQRGTVQERSITTSESFQAAIGDRVFAQPVRCVRHTLQVVAVYDTYQQAGELFDASEITVLDDETGEVRFGIEVDLT